MSRIGRLPVTVPSGVDVAIDGQTVKVKGPKGELSHVIAAPITIEQGESGLEVKRPDDQRESHSITVEPPSGITFVVENQTRFSVQGIDKQLVGEVAANIRKLRKPDPYKGKGVRYAGEQIRRKVGKAGK